MTPLKHIYCLLLAMLFAMNSIAQERKIQNKPYIDERQFHYGFFVGVHDQGIKLQNSGHIDPNSGAQWTAENDGQNFGFSVGILGDWKLASWLNLRLSPGLHFGSKHIKFRNLSDGETKTQDMKSCYIGMPIDLKVSGPRFNNYRPYVIAGIAPMYDLTSGKQTLLRSTPYTTTLEIGLGCDLYLPYFKLIPELKFSFGLNNILRKNRPDLTDSSQYLFTQSVDRATFNMVSLCFYFE